MRANGGNIPQLAATCRNLRSTGIFFQYARITHSLCGERAAVNRFGMGGGREGTYPPHVLNEGKVLDGRNRYLACEAVKVEPKMVEYEGDDPLAYVVSLNLKRRHLNASQRASIAADVADLRQGRPEINPPNGGNTKQTTQAEAAEMLGTFEHNVQRARVVKERGVPELEEAVRRGEVSVAAARMSRW